MLRWCRAWYTVCNNAGWNRMLYGCTHAVFMADEEMIWRAYKELVMVRDGVCSLSSDEFFRDDVLAF